MNKSNQIIFYAPVGTGLPSHMLGGGENGCIRTREILTSSGYEVLTIDKPVMGKGTFNYILMAIKAYIKVLSLLMKYKNSVLYIVGFYEKNILLEWINLITGKILRHSTIYEARNGRLVKAYQEYGALYKAMMDNILRNADLVFAQGLEYVDFIKNNYKKNAVYTPNYVMNTKIKPYNSNRSFEPIRILYFGRVSASKNVNIVVETGAALANKGYDIEITIIGGFTKEYISSLNEIINMSGLDSEKVQIMGSQPFEVIGMELQRAHFFVFPSQEKMEGHSNALTEAMTFGVVPIVSKAGFNESIVSNNDLVVNNALNVSEYVDIIDKILRDESWQTYSKHVFERIKKNYTEDHVRSRIISAIRGLE